MLGTQPDIIREYVETGQVKIVFWPVLNHGDPSVYATLTSECVGRQNAAAFWQVHEQLYENYSELWGATRDYFVDIAVSVGADRAAFEACYDSEGLETVMALDALRRERGIYSQPVFDINGQIFAGAGSFEAFSVMIEEALAATE